MRVPVSRARLRISSSRVSLVLGEVPPEAIACAISFASRLACATRLSRIRLRYESRYEKPPASSASAKMLTARIRGVSETRFDHLSASSRSSLFVGEAVPGAIQGLDSIELGIDLPELAAYAFDVAVDGAV